MSMSEGTDGADKAVREPHLTAALTGPRLRELTGVTFQVGHRHVILRRSLATWRVVGVRGSSRRTLRKVHTNGFAKRVGGRSEPNTNVPAFADRRADPHVALVESRKVNLSAAPFHVFFRLRPFT